MNIALWIVQWLLGVAFIMAGGLKLTQPYDALAKQMAWVRDFKPNTVKLIGGLELLGGIGLIAPALSGVLPWLTPLAAVGLALTMLGAISVHLRRQEMPNIAVNVVLLLLAVFVIYGRFIVAPFS